MIYLPQKVQIKVVQIIYPKVKQHSILFVAYTNQLPLAAAMVFHSMSPMSMRPSPGAARGLVALHGAFCMGLFWTSKG